MSKITDLLERAWTKNAYRVHAEGYDLVILAVPRHPANIEAIAAIELDLVADLLEGFVKAREVSHGLRGAEKEIDAQFRADARIEGGDSQPEAGDLPNQMGQGRDTGGLSQVNGNEAPAQGEDHTAVDAVDLSDIPETGEEWFMTAEARREARCERAYATEIADWCERELKGAKENGAPMGRAYVQNIHLIIAALREYADNPMLRIANRVMPRADPEDERNFHALVGGGK